MNLKFIMVYMYYTYYRSNFCLQGEFIYHNKQKNPIQCDNLTHVKKKATICSLIWNIVYYQCTFLNNERCWKINPARLLFVPYFTLSLSWNVNKTKRVATNRGGVRGVSYCVTRARGLFQMKLVYLLQIYEYLRQQLYYLFKKNSCDSTMWVFFSILTEFSRFYTM